MLSSHIQFNIISMLTILSLVPKAFNDLSSLVGCSDAVSTWFLQNALLLNPEKTEAIIFGTRQRLAGTQTSAGVSVAGTVVHFAEAVKLLGVTLIIMRDFLPISRYNSQTIQDIAIVTMEGE